jgi:hypothetical protein
VLGAGLIWKLRSGYIYVPHILRPWIGIAQLKIGFIRVIAMIDSGALKVLFSTFQIVMSVSWNLNITFPEPYNKFTQLMSFLQLDFFNLECLQSSYYAGVYVASVFPMFLSVIIWAVFALRYSFQVAMHHEKDIKQVIFTEHMHMFLLVVYLFLPPVAAIQFRALNCMKLADGQSYLRADTSVNCNSDGYYDFTIVNGFLITIYQSLPLFYIALLCRVRKKLNPIMGSPELALKTRDNDESLDAIRFLFNDYKCSRWYFEVVDLYRRMFYGGILPHV